MAGITLAFSENAGIDGTSGWISFYSYIPDFLCRLNNDFYSIKNGQIWQHFDNENPIRNNFYGVQHDSSITTIFNDVHESDKIFKTLVLEADEDWSAELETNLTEGTIAADEFDVKESLRFAYTRQNEDPDSTYGLAVNGIGNITNVAGFNITFSSIPYIISIGDVLVQMNGSAQEVIGTITNINRTTNVVTVASITNTPVVGRFSFSRKDYRVQAENIKGLWMEVKLTNDSIAPSELAAVRSEVILTTGLK